MSQILVDFKQACHNIDRGLHNNAELWNSSKTSSYGKSNNDKQGIQTKINGDFTKSKTVTLTVIQRLHAFVLCCVIELRWTNTITNKELRIRLKCDSGQ